MRATCKGLTCCSWAPTQLPLPQLSSNCDLRTSHLSPSFCCYPYHKGKSSAVQHGSQQPAVPIQQSAMRELAWSWWMRITGLYMQCSGGGRAHPMCVHGLYILGSLCASTHSPQLWPPATLNLHRLGLDHIFHSEKFQQLSAPLFHTPASWRIQICSWKEKKIHEVSKWSLKFYLIRPYVV